jgi:oxygen-dependent protoporphyrinogen oxidase
VSRYVVVGAGISGLAAAWELVQHVPAASVTVLEATDRVGGRLRAGTVAGVTVDVGAESLLARRPEAVELLDEVGLTPDVVHPATTAARVWSRGELHPLPSGTVVGVPADPSRLVGLLTEEEIARAAAEVVTPAPPGATDVAVGELVAARLGDAVADRLVEPLLGGVYAGHARLLSTAAAAPPLLRPWLEGTSLLEAVRRAAPPQPAQPAGRPSPVFAGVRGGVHRLPAAVADALRARGARIRTGTVVRELRRRGDAWELVTGPVPAPVVLEADTVLLALPPAPTARLLRGPAPGAAELLSGVETASMAVVTLAFRNADLPELPGSGLLVPPVDGRRIKAATFSAAKWDWVAEAGRGAGPAGEDLTLLRASLGRHREESTLQHPDDDLVAAVLADLGEALGAALPAPLDAHVQRWGGGLPQYAVGHRELVAAVSDHLTRVPGLEVAGATYEGVGVPACIASGRAAARRLLGQTGPA